MNGTQRIVAPRPPNLPPSLGDEPANADDQEIEDDQADTGTEQPVFTFPAPNPAGGTPVFMPMPNNGQTPGTTTAPVITLQPGPNGPAIYNFVPTDAAPGTTPQSPTSTPTFGVIGSPTPGMIQVPPQQPASITRPPARPPGS
jgi:hypothetical protein